MNSNLYRFAVVNDVYVSDNAFTKTTIDKLWNTFGTNDGSKELRVYGSSVLRTSSANNGGGAQYYQNMDTAFKFWEATLKGTKSSNWNNSASINGSVWENKKETLQPTRSVINYYDNQFVFPKGESKKIYIRHVDATNIKDIKSSNIKDEALIDIKFDIGHAMQISSDYTSFIKYLSSIGVNGYSYGIDQSIKEKFSEYYERNMDGNLIFPNVKYKVNDGTLGYMSYLPDDLSQLTQDEIAKINKLINQYNCLGAVVGKGSTLDEAISNRNQTLDSINIRSFGIGNNQTYSTGRIINGGDTTNVTVSSEETEDYIVIDFYYEKKPTKIYVRHIDVSNTNSIGDDQLTDSARNITRLQTNRGKAVYIKNTDWLVVTGQLDTTSKDVKEKNITYQELYEKKSGTNPVKVLNIKYDHETAGSYWDLLTSSQKSTYSQYTCIGAVVAKGDTIDDAINKKSDIKQRTFNNVKSNFKSNMIEADRFVDKNSDYTSVVITNNEYNVIVIDFYYNEIPRGSKDVYVRHIDVSGIADNNINSSAVDNAIRTGKVLAGKGTALKNNSTNINKSNIVRSGYQELYQVNSKDKIEVFRDPSDDYICIGSNMTTDNTSNIERAKGYMDDILNSRAKFDTSKLNSRIAEQTDKDVILIDFYYRSRHTGTPISRTKKGRLAFYTTGQSDQFKNYVNNHTSTDNAVVYDVIPSSEVLRTSIDNAYSYMLGAINIKEQTKEGTYSFDYTLNQSFKVTYKDWSATCDSCGKTYSDKRTSACTNSIPVTCPEGVTGSSCTKSCGGTKYTYSFEWINTTGTASRTYTYTIPYKYTYYKVKNMRLYTISKMELLDGYSNNGLSLFDGQTHTILPTDSYKNSFNSSQFNLSSNSETSTMASKDLSSTLEYTYNNEDGDVQAGFVQNVVKLKILEFFKNINHSDAAKIKTMDKDGNITGWLNDANTLKATLYVKNDEIHFRDGISGNDIYLVGENNNVITTKENSNYEYSNRKSEKEATKVIDLSKYTKDKSTYTGSTKYTYTASNSDKVNVSTVYPKSVNSKYMPRTNLTDNRYFNIENLNIPESRLNGKRYSYGKIYYNLLSGNSSLNFDVDDSKVVNGTHDWNKASNRKVVNGIGGNTFVDTEMYNTSGINNPGKTTFISPTALGTVEFEYGKDNRTDADIVDVFTPIAFETQIVANTSKNRMVDHTIENHNTEQTKQIQKNSQFTIQMNATNNSHYYSSLLTKKYIGQYYIKFNFDVQDITIYDAQKSSGRRYESVSVPAGSWIGPIYNKYGNTIATNGIVKISAYALEDPNVANNVVNQESNNYDVRAVAVNAPSSLIYDVKRGRISESTTFITNVRNQFSSTGSNNRDHNGYYDQKNIYGHSNYVADKHVETENISRVYDFKVTDLKDVDWKNIFRKSTSTTTNVHSGNAYYSGTRKWNVYTTEYNQMLERNVAEIGATKQQILPLGPYKNTNSTYVKAPKLGYKFSFDLKTTGATSNKKVVITPSFYYISKNGTGYTTDVKLYYKNSSNKYVSIDNYNLYFVPDDGYRLTFEGTDQAYRFNNSTMKKSSVNLGSTKQITLTKNMMEQADNMFVQIWYGEYKLPNSTIIVAKDATGKYNINNNLTNGYIGIKFDIKVYEYTNSSMSTVSKVLSYSQNNKNASSSTNTSQWDYEGYLGFANPGNSARNIKIALEKGTWNLDNDTYNKIKGTVILYDTDAKASSDYD